MLRPKAKRRSKQSTRRSKAEHSESEKGRSCRHRDRDEPWSTYIRSTKKRRRKKSGGENYGKSRGFTCIGIRVSIWYSTRRKFKIQGVIERNKKTRINFSRFHAVWTWTSSTCFSRCRVKWRLWPLFQLRSCRPFIPWYSE